MEKLDRQSPCCNQVVLPAMLGFAFAVNVGLSLQNYHEDNHLHAHAHLFGAAASVTLMGSLLERIAYKANNS